jgi:hypothetical protein
MDKNLWFLTEERPKKEVLQVIFKKFASDYNLAIFIDTIRIFPILVDDKFTFTYEITGFRCNKINKFYLKTVSGYSSFVDFLIFYQIKEPTLEDQPLYAIEETKTDDKESRNTGVYQRCSKFIFIQNYYPNSKKVMLYNLQVEQKEKPTDTYIFGTKLLLTLGVEILGKKLDPHIFTPFKTIDEIILLKNKMKKAPAGNTPILITKSDNKIEVSGRLIKNGRLAHDPNIGALTIIGAVLRKLGWEKTIEITEHGLLQKDIATSKNKFIQIANQIGLSLVGIELPETKLTTNYWKYEVDGEKLATIFIHLVVENFTRGRSIFENHAGCEKGYFITKQGDSIPLEKYENKKEYKMGDKTKIAYIPDLILLDCLRNEIVNIEGKKYQYRQKGIQELDNYDFIEKNYILKHYPEFTISRTVVLYGGVEEVIVELEIGFLLNKNGKLILGIKAPKLFEESIVNLLDFWS